MASSRDTSLLTARGAHTSPQDLPFTTILVSGGGNERNERKITPFPSTTGGTRSQRAEHIAFLFRFVAQTISSSTDLTILFDCLYSGKKKKHLIDHILEPLAIPLANGLDSDCRWVTLLPLRLHCWPKRTTRNTKAELKTKMTFRTTPTSYIYVTYKPRVLKRQKS